MATYYRVNLRDKENNIVYPNIHNLINITKSGVIENVKGITLVNKCSSWKNSWTSNELISTTKQTQNDFSPIVRTETKDGNIVILGGINNQFGLYGFYSGRIESACDWRCYIDSSTGNLIQENGGLSIGKDLSVSGESTFKSDTTFQKNVNITEELNMSKSIILKNTVSEILNSERMHLVSYNRDTYGSSFGSSSDKTRIRSSGDNLYHFRSDDSTAYKILDAKNYINYTVPNTGGNFTGNISAPEIIGMSRGKTYSITIDGSSDTYYPVVINLSTAKYATTYISIWKNLGSKTPNISGNHSNGTSSMWLIYEGRNMMWDGNGGFIKGLYYSMPYANLCANTTWAGNAVGNLIVHLRGGGCQYNITTNEGSEPKVYYSSTNIGSSSYPVNVSPTTTISNGGKYSSTCLGYGRVTSCGDGSINIIAQNGNEINFGGSGEATEIYFGYRASESRPAPTKFIFGNNSNYVNIQSGLLYITKNSNTTTIGSQNSSYCHIYNSANIPFYFNKKVFVNNGYLAVGSANSSVVNLYVVSISTWNSNYSSYVNGTVAFCY